VDHSGLRRGHGAPVSEGDHEKEKAVADDGGWDRRSLLRGAAVVAGAAATAPLLGEAATAQAGGSDADALFKAGKFEQAGRAYEEVLRKDPDNAHAARQRGYVALLSNRFAEAEKYLTMALELVPGDVETTSCWATATSGKTNSPSPGCMCPLASGVPPADTVRAASAPGSTATTRRGEMAAGIVIRRVG
jgi:tetratricopeptide (TPR) repeat protein